MNPEANHQAQAPAPVFPKDTPQWAVILFNQMFVVEHHLKTALAMLDKVVPEHEDETPESFSAG